MPQIAQTVESPTSQVQSKKQLERMAAQDALRKSNKERKAAKRSQKQRRRNSYQSYQNE